MPGVVVRDARFWGASIFRFSFVVSSVSCCRRTCNTEGGKSYDKIFCRPSVENRDAISKKPYSNSSLSACVCICKKVQRFNTLCYDLRVRVPSPGFACSQEWKGGCTNLGII